VVEQQAVRNAPPVGGSPVADRRGRFQRKYLGVPENNTSSSSSDRGGGGTSVSPRPPSSSRGGLPRGGSRRKAVRRRASDRYSKQRFSDPKVDPGPTFRLLTSGGTVNRSKSDASDVVARISSTKTPTDRPDRYPSAVLGKTNYRSSLSSSSSHACSTQITGQRAQ